MRVLIEPTLDQWPIRANAQADRASVAVRVSEHAERLGGSPLTQTGPLIATGHQAWLWHPGILAKYIALAKAAEQRGAGLLQIVVDHDVHEALSLELPIRQNERLTVEKLDLAPQDLSLPLASVPPANARVVCARLRSARDRFGTALEADLDPMIAAFTGLPRCRTLAEQLSVVLSRLMTPYTGSIPLLFASDLASLDGFADFLGQMKADVTRCVNCYNQAVEAQPDAGITPMRIERKRVEVPLWVLGWQQPRRRVFADRTGREPVLTLESGEPIDTTQMTLAPRALLLTGLLRHSHCDLFIHGKGGAIYDRLTEEWFQSWLNVQLAPSSVVSADLYMTFDALLASPADVVRAKWWVHHLPHNLDRALTLSGTLVDRKRILLDQMDDDHDRARRAESFAQIHRINDALAHQHPEAMADAQQKLDLAQAGVVNRHIANKRDWCFALYRPEQLRELTERMDSGT